jgi:hypothetical protein
LITVAGLKREPTTTSLFISFSITPNPVVAGIDSHLSFDVIPSRDFAEGSLVTLRAPTLFKKHATNAFACKQAGSAMTGCAYDDTKGSITALITGGALTTGISATTLKFENIVVPIYPSTKSIVHEFCLTIADTNTANNSYMDS